MGPIVILDKSAFQSLSQREHHFLDMYFMENLTPILGMELLGDLAKHRRDSVSPEKKVAELAAKFCGSGPVTNMDYRTLCVRSLLGEQFPLDGQIFPDNFTLVRASNGSWGGLIDLGPFNQAILRWSRGEFFEFEHILSKYWRRVTRSLSLKSFGDQLNTHHVIIPRVEGTEDLIPVTESLLATATLQDVWLNWLLGQLALPMHIESIIRGRWRFRANLLLRDFAPYAWFCLRVLLALLIATRFCLVKWKSTNLLDIQYLYYLPFCMVFVSDDRLHKFLAPLLMRKDQSFVIGKELKMDLRRLADERERFTEKQQSMLEYALGSYPLPAKNSIVHKLWKRHMRPWRPGMGNLASDLSDEEKQEAVRWVKQIFIEVEGNGYFEENQTVR